MKDPAAVTPSNETAVAPSLRLCIVLLIANCCVRLLVALGLPLFHEEAYFWEWSRFPSIGYLDYPPMVAWIIGLFTRPFGNHAPILVRAGALLLGTGNLVLIYTLGLQIFNRTVARRALLLALCLPMLNIVGIVMLPDGPLVFFHLLALNLLVSAIRTDGKRRWYLGGVALGAELLSKLTAVFTVVSLFLFLAVCPAQRVWLRRKEMYVAILLAIVVFSPFLYWNLTHDWASVRLQLWERHQEGFGPGLAKLGEFLFEQLANTSPFLVIPLVGCLFVSTANLPVPWQGWYRLMRYQSLTILGFFLVVGTMAQTHPQWTVLAYPTAAITLAVLWTSVPNHRLVRGLKWWIGFSYGTSLLAAGLLLLGASVVSPGTLKDLGGPLGPGLVKGQLRLVGWSDLRQQLEPFMRQVASDDQARLFVNGYHRAAQLSFHHEGEPVINVDAYLHKGKGTGNAQWYYLPPERVDGTSGIYVADLHAISDGNLRLLFASAEELGIIEQRSAGHVLGQYRIFRVEHFKSNPGRGTLRPLQGKE